jgi:hypothetical protein
MHVFVRLMVRQLGSANPNPIQLSSSAGITRPEPPSASPVSPITFPATDASSALGKALASCEPKVDASELSLPGARGEIKLDQCYRGRDYLVCQFNALTAEAKSLLENYRKIVDANYLEVRDVGGICTINPEVLATDLKSATEFGNRFKGIYTGQILWTAAQVIAMPMASVRYQDRFQLMAVGVAVSAAHLMLRIAGWSYRNKFAGASAVRTSARPRRFCRLLLRKHRPTTG